MTLFDHLLSVCRYLNRYQLIKESSFSKSQLYHWFKYGVHERKVRECKPVSRHVVEEAIDVIWQYPHFGAPKGQCYMIYYRLGYMPQHLYKRLKKMVQRLVFQEVSKRKLLPEHTSYEHERADKPGQIWAEDFSQLRVFGVKFYVALVIDVALPHYLGATASLCADDEMVEGPVIQALAVSGGKGPLLFLISDNGGQNEEIPRPALKGVTPADVLKGIVRERIETNRKYLEIEQEKEVPEPWRRNDWTMVKKHLFKGTVNNLELMTKFCFFLKRPLRKLAKLEHEVLGN